MSRENVKIAGWQRNWSIGILAVLVVLSGCGGGGDGGGGDGRDRPAARAEEAAVREVLAQAVDALYDGDGARACSLYTSPYRRELVRENQADPSELAPKGASCEDQVEAYAPIVKRLVPGRAVEVIRVRVEGDTATAVSEFKTTRGKNRITEFLVREDGEWKIDGDRDAGAGDASRR